MEGLAQDSRLKAMFKAINYDLDNRYVAQATPRIQEAASRCGALAGGSGSFRS